MNTGTITTAATVLAVAAAAFAGCAVEESTTPPSSDDTNSPSGNPSNTVMGVTNSVNNTSANTSAAVTNSNTTVAATTTTSGGVTATTAPAVTATTAPATTVTTAAAGPTTGGAASTTSGGGGCALDPGDGTAPLIDDFTDNDHTILPNEGRVGYWYEYNDETATGTQTTTPIDGAEGTGGMLTSTASGFTDFGAGVGVDLNNQAGEPCDYDASFYTGIEFTITTNVALTFKVALKATEGDSGHYEYPIPATGGAIQVPFTMLAQPTWAKAADWDPSKILQLQWQAAAGDDYTITLDDVSFYK